MAGRTGPRPVGVGPGQGTQRRRQDWGSASAQGPSLAPSSPQCRLQETQWGEMRSFKLQLREKDPPAPGKMGKWHFHAEYVTQIG